MLRSCVSRHLVNLFSSLLVLTQAGTGELGWEWALISLQSFPGSCGGWFRSSHLLSFPVCTFPQPEPSGVFFPLTCWVSWAKRRPLLWHLHHDELRAVQVKFSLLFSCWCVPNGIFFPVCMSFVRNQQQLLWCGFGVRDNLNIPIVRQIEVKSLVLC